MSGMEVVAAGLAGITDLGRHGKAHLGVQENGAGDPYAARMANILVSNPESAPLIEVTTVAPFALRTRGRLLIAVTGAAGPATIDGHPLPLHTPFLTWAGAVVQVPPAAGGLRAYVGVHGRLEGDEFLGSVALDPLIGRGRRLRAGDPVEVVGGDVRPPPHLPFFRPAVRQLSRPPYPNDWLLDVVPGPEATEFPTFFSGLETTSFRVGSQSDHVGVRLEGHLFTRGAATELLSRGVPFGAIEVPPSGGLIALLRGRPLTAGYPVPAVVARSSHSSLGQLRPGDTVRLRQVNAAASLATARHHEARLETLRERCAAMFGASRLFDTPPARTFAT